MNRIRLSNIELSFLHDQEEKIIFKSFSYEFTKPNIYCITGPSGKGKTTLLNLIVGKLKPTKGRVYYDEKIILSKINDSNKIFYVDSIPNYCLSIEELYILVLLNQGKKLDIAKKMVNECLKNTPIQKLYKKRLDKLSQGEIKMVKFYLHRLFECDFYIFDEPFAGIYKENLHFIEEELLNLSKKIRSYNHHPSIILSRRIHQ